MSYAKELDMCSDGIKSRAKHYHAFVRLKISVVNKLIPRGYPKGWNENEEYTGIYEEFEDSWDTETDDHLLRSFEISWDKQNGEVDFC